MSGSGFRPIADTWILARPKVAYYGAYPSGFLERARSLLGVSIFDPVLHVCGGRVRDYPFRGFGPNDRTIDLDPELGDYCFDVRELGVRCGDRFPLRGSDDDDERHRLCADGRHGPERCKPRRVADGVISVLKDQDAINRAALWPAVLADPPYGPGEAKHYKHAGDAYPDRTDLLRRCLSVVKPGGRVGFLDYMAPRPPKHDVRLVALVGVIVGFNNQARVFSVYEREDPTLGTMQRARALAAVRRRRE